MFNKRNSPFYVIRRSAAVWVLALAFFASNAHAMVDILNGTLIQATPFDHKLSLAGFFDLDEPGLHLNAAVPTETVESLFMKARSFRYAQDSRGDHWQTPEETDRKHSGDCEDKAVWLYAQLKHNGYTNVRLVIGKYRGFDRKYHVWVVCTDSSNASYLLDPAIQKRVWNEQGFSSGFYQPIYSFDGQHRYRYAPRD